MSTFAAWVKSAMENDGWIMLWVVHSVNHEISLTFLFWYVGGRVGLAPRNRGPQ